MPFEEKSSGALPRPVPADLKKTRITDEFFGPFLEKLRAVTLPDVLEKFLKDGAVENYRRAARGERGGHAGTPWYHGLICEVIRGASDLLARSPDPETEKKLDEIIDAIAAAQREDGWLHPYDMLVCPGQEWGLFGGNARWQHETYDCGCLIEAGVHHYRATGKTKLLACAVRCADYLAAHIGPPPKWNVTCEHSLAESALLSLEALFSEEPALAERLGAKRGDYLKLALFFIESKGRNENRHQFPPFLQEYAQDHRPAREQREAVGHAVRATLFYTGIAEAARETGVSDYAARVLLEAGLSAGVVLVDPETDRFQLSKTGWFLLNDPATKVNMAFNHDVNYLGFYKLDEALREGRPAGLSALGDWETIYEGLSSLPEQAKKSWFAFDHFYSDHSFDEALAIVFALHPKRILDVGGNTGRWALKCVEYDPDVRVTVADLPQQIGLMQEQTAGKTGADRISGYAVNLLDEASRLPAEPVFDVVWMSQFLDCFSESQIESILCRTAAILAPGSRLCIMETFWDRQRFEPAAFCLTMTSLYFTAMANGNSKMYHSDDFIRIVDRAGLEVESVHDGLGQGHTILVCKRKQ